MAMSSPDKHIRGRQAIAEAWPIATGETQPPSLAVLQIVAAQAHLESNYGEAPYKNRLTGESRVINNWGAIQAGKPPCGPGGFEVTDTHADGTPYNFCYKVYATPAEGAVDLIKAMTIKRPASWEHMKRGDIDAWAAQMRQRDPITGIGLYFEQSVEGRATGIWARVQEIASALNEPIAAQRGGPMPDAPSGGGAIASVTSSGWFLGPAVAGVVGLLATLLYKLFRR